jgi:hypothetical protein
MFICCFESKPSKGEETKSYTQHKELSWTRKKKRMKIEQDPEFKFNGTVIL